MKRFSLLLATLILSLPLTLSLQAQEAPQNLDQLLQRVRQDRTAERRFMQEREQRFVTQRNQQQRLLREARAELQKVEAETARLTAIYEENEKVLTELENELRIAVGTFGELFGVVKQVSGDFRAQIQNSIISAQVKEREPFIARLGESRELPTIDELERFWFMLQEEMTESGKVVSFEAPIVRPDGEQTRGLVTRVGSFNLTSEGRYLIYQSETDQIIQLSRQPPGHFLSTIRSLERSKPGDTVQFALDPSRGSLLSILVTAPSLRERIGHGGVVGYVILTLLAIGLVIVAERIVSLSREEKRLKAQLQSKDVDPSNPVGQLMIIFDKYKDGDIETLEVKMNEVIIKYLPLIEKGINTIKIFAAVGPLLGLLGTVTGMIATFQTITLFGTGDPKLMAGGISMALITTVLGLVCAIPLLLLHTFVSNKSKGIIQLLEEQSAGLIATRAEETGSANA
jgi:biopolymer transport protein ExbB